MDLSVRRQPGGGSAEIADVRLWASFNDGGTWRCITVDEVGAGGYTAEIAHPGNASGDVALRVQATDAEGSQISQTMMRAYGLD